MKNETRNQVMTKTQYQAAVRKLPTALRKAYRYALSDDADGSYVAGDLYDLFNVNGRLADLRRLLQSATAHEINYADSLCDAIEAMVEDDADYAENVDLIIAEANLGAGKEECGLCGPRCHCDYAEDGIKTSKGGR